MNEFFVRRIQLFNNVSMYAPTDRPALTYKAGCVLKIGRPPKDPPGRWEIDQNPLVGVSHFILCIEESTPVALALLAPSAPRKEPPAWRLVTWD